MNRNAVTVDRSRVFRLPGVQDLTKRQEEAMALPMDGQHLVIGGPGTGKSVVALHRAIQCQQAEVPYHFLVYNRLLDSAGWQLFKPVLERLFSESGQFTEQWRSNFKTWETWFPSMFCNRLKREDCPKLPPEVNSSYQALDWKGVLKVLESYQSIREVHRLIIDEGQDMPPEFYRSLVDMGFENFFVVADQNQQIVSGKQSSRKDIQDSLAINPGNVVELDENHRNSLPVAKLARMFYTGDPASPPPDLPESEALVGTPILFTYSESRFADVICRILKRADRAPRSLIGIIAPNNIVRERYLDALKHVKVDLDYARPPIRTYSARKEEENPISPNLHFDLGGIIVINMHSCKGLEFDEVFIADINQFYCNRADPDPARRKFYVMVARAKKRAFLLRQAGSNCPVDSILPSNPEILEHHGS